MASKKNLTNNDSSNKPSWLLSTISDLEERMKILSLSNPPNENDNIGDTFAERAESYYSKRPQLLALLQELYNAYVTLSDRYMQLSSGHSLRRHNSQTSVVTNDMNEENDDEESDLESSVSYQPPPQTRELEAGLEDGYDRVVAELVVRTIEAEVFAEEAWRCGEWRRKAELQGSLVEVLESERAVLLRENARAQRRCAALAEEAEAVAADAALMRRKAGELLLRVPEEQLSRKIQELQAQILSLEKCNKQLQCSKLVESEESSSSSNSSSSSSCSGSSGWGSVKRTKTKTKKKRSEMVLEGCFRKVKVSDGQKFFKKKREGKGGLSWWGRVKSMDLFLCGNVTSHSA